MYCRTLETSTWAYISQNPFYGLKGVTALFSGDRLSHGKRENLRFVELKLGKNLGKI